MDRTDEWPELKLEEWQPTLATLHRWTQMVGKLRLALTPPINHWWHVPFYVSARGITTSPIPYEKRTFEARFDLVDHNLYLQTSSGERRVIPLVPRSVAEFHRELFRVLDAMGIHVHIWRMPVEIPDPVPFDEDTEHASYEPEQVTRFFSMLRQADRALKAQMGLFYGKQSPSHFFWGSFDQAQSRYSGRRAPPRPNADIITREAYSHEVISFGFWPGTPGKVDAAFYGYHAPEPPGFKDAAVPSPGYYDSSLGEFVLPYDAVRGLDNPRKTVLDFFGAVYDAGATQAKWDREALDRPSRERGLTYPTVSA